MAKPKKEFKARLKKMQKHVTALIELAVGEAQREALYRVQGEVDLLARTADEDFKDPEPRPPTSIDGPRRDPRSIAS